jgi:hypothetical protein
VSQRTVWRGRVDGREREPSLELVEGLVYMMMVRLL